MKPNTLMFSFAFSSLTVAGIARASPTMGVEWELERKEIAVTATTDYTANSTSVSFAKRSPMPEEHGAMRLLCTKAETTVTTNKAVTFPDVAITYDLEDKSDRTRTLEIVTAPLPYDDKGAWNAKVVEPIDRVFESIERYVKTQCPSSGGCEIYLKDFMAKATLKLGTQEVPVSNVWKACSGAVGVEYDYKNANETYKIYPRFVIPDVGVVGRQSIFQLPKRYVATINTQVNLAVPLAAYGAKSSPLYTPAADDFPAMSVVRDHVADTLAGGKLAWKRLDRGNLSPALELLRAQLKDVGERQQAASNFTFTQEDLSRRSILRKQLEERSQAPVVTEQDPFAAMGMDFAEDSKIEEEIRAIDQKRIRAAQQATELARRYVELTSLIEELERGATPLTKSTGSTSALRRWGHPSALDAEKTPLEWNALTRDEQAFLSLYYITLNAEMAWGLIDPTAGDSGTALSWKAKNYFDLFPKATLVDLLTLLDAARLGPVLVSIAAADQMRALCKPVGYTTRKGNWKDATDAWCNEWAHRDAHRRSALARSVDPWQVKANHVSNPVEPWKDSGNVWLVVELRLGEHPVNTALSLVFNASGGGLTLADHDAVIKMLAPIYAK